MPAWLCSSICKGVGHPFWMASRKRCKEPTPGLPPHEKMSLAVKPASATVSPSATSCATASLSDVMSAICALGDSGGVSRQRGHHDPHECKQRQLPQDGMQLVVVGDVEDAEIRILPGYPPNVAPDVCFGRGVRVGWQVDVH